MRHASGRAHAYVGERRRERAARLACANRGGTGNLGRHVGWLQHRHHARVFGGDSAAHQRGRGRQHRTQRHVYLARAGANRNGEGEAVGVIDALQDAVHRAGAVSTGAHVSIGSEVVAANRAAFRHGAQVQRAFAEAAGVGRSNRRGQGRVKQFNAGAGAGKARQHQVGARYPGRLQHGEVQQPIAANGRGVVGAAVVVVQVVDGHAGRTGGRGPGAFVIAQRQQVNAKLTVVEDSVTDNGR